MATAAKDNKTKSKQIITKKRFTFDVVWTSTCTCLVFFIILDMIVARFKLRKSRVTDNDCRTNGQNVR